MKKKDIKYIIKRVIIGILIIFCVGFLNKCSVKANTLENAYLNVFGYNNNLSLYSSGNYPDYSFDLSDYKITINDFSSTYNSSTDTKRLNYYSIIFKDPQDNYIIFTNNTFRDTTGFNGNFTSIDFTSSSINYYDSNTLALSDTSYSGFIMFNNISLYNTFISSMNNIFVNDYNLDNFNQQLYTGSNNNNTVLYNYTYLFENNVDRLPYIYNLLSYLFNNYEVVHTSMPMKINGQDILINNDIGDNININANYNVNNCNSLIFDDNTCNLNNFFSTGLFINGVPYNINLYSDLNIYENVYYSVFRLKNRYNRYEYGYLVFSPRQSDLRVVKVDINIDENTGNLSYKFYNELGELSNDSFYVNSFIITSLEDIPDTVINNYNHTDLDSLKLSYSTDIFIHTDFNLNFFQSFDLYYSNITFINVNGTPIEDFYRLRTQAIMQEGINNGGSSWGDEIDSNTSNSNFLENLLNIVKLPFKFLNDTVSISCSKLSLPIPFLNSTIDLPCMNSLYRSVLGNFYEIISIVINAFVLYRIGINVASTVKNIVDPTTDRIAVMDL